MVGRKFSVKFDAVDVSKEGIDVGRKDWLEIVFEVGR
jgi:hypothetical protein